MQGQGGALPPDFSMPAEFSTFDRIEAYHKQEKRWRDELIAQLGCCAYMRALAREMTAAGARWDTNKDSDTCRN